MKSNFPTVLFSVQSAKTLNRRKPFKTFRWRSSEQLPNQLSYTFWELDTKQSYLRFIRYIQMDTFFRGVDPQLFQGYVDAPGFLTDRLVLSLLKALASRQFSFELGEQRQNLLQRLQPLQAMLGIPLWSWNLLYTWDKEFEYGLQHIRVPIRKVNKFSGYVKTPSAVGSKRKTSTQDLDPESVEYISFVKLDFDKYFMSPAIAFDDLGVPAGTILYTLLKSCYDKREQVPDDFKSMFM